MAAALDLAPYDRALKRFDPGGVVLRARMLKDGPSAIVTALDVRRGDGASEGMVLRRYRGADAEAARGRARGECRLLELLRGSSVPTPHPYALDERGAIFAEPYIVMQRIDGEPALARPPSNESIPRMAATLAAIHCAGRATLDFAFLPRQSDVVAALLARRPQYKDASADERAVLATLAAVWPLPQRNPAVLLHGDFWPGNVLWRDTALVGVIDWEDAALGDPLADLANSRFELLWAYGAAAMRAFTRAYLALQPALDPRDLPYWDLYADLRLATRISAWTDDPASQQAMRTAHRAFIAGAFARLAAATQASTSARSSVPGKAVSWKHEAMR